MFYILLYNKEHTLLLERPRITNDENVAKRIFERANLANNGVTFDRDGLPSIEQRTFPILVEASDLLDLKNRFPQHVAAMAATVDLDAKNRVTAKRRAIVLTKTALINRVQKLADTKPTFVKHETPKPKLAIKPVVRPGVPHAKNLKAAGASFFCPSCHGLFTHNTRTQNAVTKGRKPYCDECNAAWVEDGKPDYRKEPEARKNGPKVLRKRVNGANIVADPNDHAAFMAYLNRKKER